MTLYRTTSLAYFPPCYYSTPLPCSARSYSQSYMYYIVIYHLFCEMQLHFLFFLLCHSYCIIVHFNRTIQEHRPAFLPTIVFSPPFVQQCSITLTTLHVLYTILSPTLVMQGNLLTTLHVLYYILAHPCLAMQHFTILCVLYFIITHSCYEMHNHFHHPIYTLQHLSLWYVYFTILSPTFVM